MILPGLGCHQNISATITVLQFYVRFVSDTVEIFMEAIQEECEELLTVLLLE